MPVGDPRYADSLYSLVRRSVDVTTMSAPEVIALMASAMTSVDGFGRLAGVEKKQAVIEVLSRILFEIPADREGREELIAAVMLLAPPMIDLVVATARRASPKCAGCVVG